MRRLEHGPVGHNHEFYCKVFRKTERSPYPQIVPSNAIHRAKKMVVDRKPFENFHRNGAERLIFWSARVIRLKPCQPIFHHKHLMNRRGLGALDAQSEVSPRATDPWVWPTSPRSLEAGGELSGLRWNQASPPPKPRNSISMIKLTSERALEFVGHYVEARCGASMRTRGGAFSWLFAFCGWFVDQPSIEPSFHRTDSSSGEPPTARLFPLREQKTNVGTQCRSERNSPVHSVVPKPGLYLV